MQLIQSGQVPAEVDIFIIAGQSNAAGTGTGYPTRQALLSPGGIIFSGSSHATVFPIDPPNTLCLLCALLTTEGALNNRGHGIELNLCYQYRNAFGKPCIVMKETAGSTSLAVDWAEDSDLRDSLIDRANALMTLLTGMGKTATIKGFYWNQWEGDADTTAYKTNLENFIADLRANITGMNDQTFIAACRPSVKNTTSGSQVNRRASIENADITNYGWLDQDDLFYVQPAATPIHCDSWSQNLLAERFLAKIYPTMNFI